MKLWELIEKESKDKTQTWGILNNGNCGYCIDGLIIKAIEPDMNIEYCVFGPIDDFIKNIKINLTLQIMKLDISQQNKWFKI